VSAPGLTRAALRLVVITEVREAASCGSDDGDQCPKCTRHADAILAAVAAQEPEAAPGDGAALIAAERRRQVSQEGYAPAHDREHAGAELSLAAAAYALAASGRWQQGLAWWPFDGGFKPAPEPLGNLVRAGALAAAEIDRLQGTAPAASPGAPGA